MPIADRYEAITACVSNALHRDRGWSENSEDDFFCEYHTLLASEEFELEAFGAEVDPRLMSYFRQKVSSKSKGEDRHLFVLEQMRTLIAAVSGGCKIQWTTGTGMVTGAEFLPDGRVGESVHVVAIPRPDLLEPGYGAVVHLPDRRFVSFCSLPIDQPQSFGHFLVI